MLDPEAPQLHRAGQAADAHADPAMAMKDGKPWASFGVMGANFQPMGHVYLMTNLLDYGLDPQETLDAPRVFFEGQTLWCEE